MTKPILRSLLFFWLMLTFFMASASRSGKESSEAIDFQIEYFIDSSGSGDARKIINEQFSQLQASVLSLDFVDYPVWLHIQKENKGAANTFYLDINYPLLDTLKVFLKEGDRWILRYEMGAVYPISARPIEHAHYVLPFELKGGQKVDMLLRIRSTSPIQVPVHLYSKKDVFGVLGLWNFGKGLFYGLLLVMFFYNLFISLVTRDPSYYYYVIYVLFIGITQMLLDGTFQRHFSGMDYRFLEIAVITTPAIAGIFAIQFAKFFLHVKEYSKALYYGFVSMQILYALAICLVWLGFYQIAFRTIDAAGLIASVYALVVAAVISYKGYNPAKMFLLAWSFFFAGIIIFVLTNLGVIRYSTLTEHVLQLGISAEVILLSIALANRINILRKQTQESQAEALRVSMENERIIRDQNIVLEQKVNERTTELQESNEELTVTLSNLREAQAQLVDAEKMASLGQLTAGIAHEINNPINFVTSNITPLKRDLEEMYAIIEAYQKTGEGNVEETLMAARQLMEELDYSFLRQEIDSLVIGIADGANRTSEIVKGLRSFSRLDEDAVKGADINEGIDSTLVLLRSKMGHLVKVVTEYDDNLRQVECYPGKLNQVFMNILSNAIYAVEHKVFTDEDQACITISTREVEESVEVSIRDNGIGMSEETKKKIFEPFFTTKDVGEGTGLGMSIVFKIIEKHRGKLDVQSELGVGTEFIITLPMRQPKDFE